MRCLFPAARVIAAMLLPWLTYPAASAGQPGASSTAADEAAIRQLVQQSDQGKPGQSVKDRIFWSGAYKRPTVGPEPGEEIPSGRQPSLRVPNSQRNKTDIVRIEVAKSGDLAYEFSNYELSFELKSGEKISIPSSVLRVWKKEDGQWKVAAMFAHPHYREGEKPK